MKAKKILLISLVALIFLGCIAGAASASEHAADDKIAASTDLTYADNALSGASTTLMPVSCMVADSSSDGANELSSAVTSTLPTTKPTWPPWIPWAPPIILPV